MFQKAEPGCSKNREPSKSKQENEENKNVLSIFLENVVEKRVCDCWKNYNKAFNKNFNKGKEVSKRLYNCGKEILNYKSTRDAIIEKKQSDYLHSNEKPLREILDQLDAPNKKKYIKDFDNISQEENFLVSTQRRPLVCACPKRRWQKLTDILLKDKMPQVPDGKTKYNIIGVKEFADQNMYILGNVFLAECYETNRARINEKVKKTFRVTDNEEQNTKSKKCCFWTKNTDKRKKKSDKSANRNKINKSLPQNMTVFEQENKLEDNFYMSKEANVLNKIKTFELENNLKENAETIKITQENKATSCSFFEIFDDALIRSQKEKNDKITDRITGLLQKIEKKLKQRPCNCPKKY